MKKTNLHSIGYTISVAGVILILFWIGIFKFTPTEAKGIEPLVRNSFLTSWMYTITSVQGASNIIGAVEIIAAVCLLLHFFGKKAGIIGGILSIITFLVTLSFIFTTPGSWKIVDNIPVTQFFILKDLMALGISVMVLGRSLERNT